VYALQVADAGDGEGERSRRTQTRFPDVVLHDPSVTIPLSISLTYLSPAFTPFRRDEGRAWRGGLQDALGELLSADRTPRPLGIRGDRRSQRDSLIQAARGITGRLRPILRGFAADLPRSCRIVCCAMD
jgi:hypothetical protein